MFSCIYRQQIIFLSVGGSFFFNTKHQFFKIKTILDYLGDSLGADKP